MEIDIGTYMLLFSFAIWLEIGVNQGNITESTNLINLHSAEFLNGLMNLPFGTLHYQFLELQDENLKLTANSTETVRLHSLVWLYIGGKH